MEEPEESPEFPERVRRAVLSAVAQLASEGRAVLEESTTSDDMFGPSEFIEITPTNPKACSISICLDYPTVSYGGATCEMFGTADERVETLLKEINDVTAGRFRYRYIAEKTLILRRTVTILQAEWMQDGRWVEGFSRGPEENDKAGEVHVFEPY